MGFPCNILNKIYKFENVRSVNIVAFPDNNLKYEEKTVETRAMQLVDGK